jgi:uncharacterized membrane protein SirB2
MNFALLWIDALVVALLWVAMLAAIVGRARRRWVRGLLLPVVAGVPLVPLGTFAFAAIIMKFQTKAQPNWFVYAISLLLAYIVGATLILRRASRREPGSQPAAATWRRMPLALAWLMAIAIGYLTLVNMDLAIRARCAIQSVEVNSVYLASLPAISSDSQNAAPLYEKAFSDLQESREEESTIHNPPTGDRDTFDPSESATIAFLAHQSSTIELLRRAAALPGCRFDQDLGELDLNLIFADLNAERNAANILNLDAREEVARGQVAAATADAMSIRRMGRQFGQRPMIISGLVGIAIDALGDSTLETVLPAVTNRAQLAVFDSAELPSMGRMFQQCLREEERWGLGLYGNMPQSTLPVQVWLSPPGLQGAFARVFYLNSDAYVGLMENAQHLIVQPYFEVRTDWSKLDGPGSGNDLLTSIVFPAISRMFETCAIAEARDVCADTAVAMTRYRVDHGTLPTRLSELVPNYLDAVPIDPFDGKPLRLIVKNDRSIIYSIGPDGVDNGGESMDRRKGDVIFTLKHAQGPAATQP